MHVVETLAADDAGEILVVEPYLRELPRTLREFPRVRKAELADALEADVNVRVNHRQFLRIDREMLNLKIVIDTQGAWRSQTAGVFTPET